MAFEMKDRLQALKHGVGVSHERQLTEWHTCTARSRASTNRMGDWASARAFSAVGPLLWHHVRCAERLVKYIHVHVCIST